MRGAPEAIVAISTCEGIRGQIVLPSETYYIEPRGAGEGQELDWRAGERGTVKSQGVHYIFQESHRKPTNHKCGKRKTIKILKYFCGK